MITEMILDFFINIVTTIISWVTSAIPNIDIGLYMIEYTAKILTITTQANNMMHFLLGDFVVVLIPGTIGLLVYKYIAYPIITFIRSIFVNGNN